MFRMGWVSHPRCSRAEAALGRGVSVTKIEIISRVAADTGLTKVKAEEAVETIIDVVKATLKNGEPVILRRFGSFRIRSK